MSKVSMVGTFTCQDGKAEEMEAASGEPGVEIYSYHRGEENTFWFFAGNCERMAMPTRESTVDILAKL